MSRSGSPPGSLVGRHLPGNYVLGDLLGRGGMGRVYEATHLPSRRAVAVKVLDPKLARHPAHLERFRREAETTSRLGHPNIVQVECFDHEGADVAFYVMERLEGVTLSALLRREGRLPPQRAVTLTAQVLEGLTAAHQAGVIHRDLKPANLFVTTGPDGKELLKVVDFGLAKLLTSNAPKLTVTGTVIGTPHYLSPEQALGQATTPQSDLFACGVILYELLSGKRPFDGADVAELMKNILRGAPERLDEVAPDVPRALADAVHRALARDPRKRFSSAASMRRALRNALAPAPQLSAAATGNKRAKKTKRTLAKVAAVLGVAGLFGLGVAVAVDLGLTYYFDEEPRLVESSSDALPAVIPIPSFEALPYGGPPEFPNIPICERAVQAACRCTSPTGPAACSRATELFDTYRSAYATKPVPVETMQTGCRSLLHSLDPDCRP